MAAKRPLKRKLEIAIAGYLLDKQKADPTFLPRHAIVCATTGRSPDDPEEGQVAPTEPDMPYTSVGCQQVRSRPDFPPGYGIKDATVIIYSKTHASDEARALADDRVGSVSELLEDSDTATAALNQPTVQGTPDTRRQKALYIYAIEDINYGDDHTETTWEDELIAELCCQDFDPAYA